MDIDFVINRTKDMTGLSCYSSNLQKALSKRIRLREIDTSKNIPKIMLIIGKILPFNIKTIASDTPLFLPIRKKVIVHLTSQYFALVLLFHKGKSVVTVHDLIRFEYSKNEMIVGDKPSLLRELLLRATSYALKKADRIIVDSDYTKKRLTEILGYPQERIDKIYLGINKGEFRPLEVKKDRFTVLYVGSEIARKNLPILIKAFAKLKKRIPEAKLVKVGLPQLPGSRKALKEMIFKLGVSDSVIFKDHVKNLALEYSKAAVFVHPSIYEGFGLPVLEAMACGCPVICSNATSLPEVGGNAVIYFDPANPEELAQKMYSVLIDEKLRKKLSKDGIVRAKEFSWEKTAQKTAEVYEKLK